MKKHLKKLRPLLLLTALLLLTNCQEDFNEHGHGDASQEATGMKIVRKSFKDFKDLAELLDKTISRERLRKTNDSTDIYNFDIDSTDVMEVTTDAGTYYTMPITRNFAYPVEGMFENLVIANTATSQDAYIMSYKPDDEFYESEQHHTLPVFKGAFSTTRIDYKALQKDSFTTCITMNVLYCNAEYGEHIATSACYGSPNLYYVAVTTCTTFIRDAPIFTGLGKVRYFFIQPGLNGGGVGGSGSGTLQDPWTNSPGSNNPPAAGQEGVGSSGPVKPGLSGPVTGPIDPDKKAHEDNCQQLKAKSQSNTFNTKMNELTAKAGTQNFESAYTLYQNAADGLLFSGEATGNSTVPEVSLNLAQSPTQTPTNCIGFMHCHLNNGTTFSTFSFGDLVALATVADASSRPTSELVLYLTTANGTFALKVKSKTILKNNLQRMMFASNSYEKSFAQNVDMTKTADQQTLGFLQFLNKEFSDTGSGIDMYQRDANGNWEKLELNSSGKKIIKKPC